MTCRFNMEITNELSEYHVEILKDLLNDFRPPSSFSTNNVSEEFKYQQLILKRLSVITNALNNCCQQDFRITNNECAIKFCKLLSKNQLILAQYLIHNDNFIVYLTKKLLTLWLLLISNEKSLFKKKSIIDNINIEEIQNQLLKKICDLYKDKLKNMSFSATIESVLEIFHKVLKDFRNRLSEVIEEDAENILSYHAGYRLLNVLNEWFQMEHITNITDMSNNLFIVPTLTVILDIKKLEMYEAEVVLDSYLVQIFQSLLEKVDSKIESICGLLCCGYLPAIRKVLDILHHTVRSSSSIDMIFTILSSMRDYTGQILAAFDVDQKLNSYPMLDNDYTEFFDRQKDNNKAINIECTKKLIDIYIEVYINVMKLFIENNINMIDIDISADIKLCILMNILTFSQELLQQNENSIEYLFNWYANNDSDLTSFMLNFVRLELAFREFKKKLINFDGESQKKIKSLMESVSLQMNHILNHFTSHDFFLKFLISTGFDHSILLDFIISNETIFLEFLLKYCKYLEQDISRFFIICKKFDKNNSKIGNCAELVLGVFNYLIQSIQSLMEKKLFPYNATPLIKRLKKVVSCLKEIVYNKDSN